MILQRIYEIWGVVILLIVAIFWPVYYLVVARKGLIIDKILKCYPDYCEGDQEAIDEVCDTGLSCCFLIQKNNSKVFLIEYGYGNSFRSFYWVVFSEGLDSYGAKPGFIKYNSKVDGISRGFFSKKKATLDHEINQKIMEASSCIIQTSNSIWYFFQVDSFFGYDNIFDAREINHK